MTKILLASRVICSGIETLKLLSEYFMDELLMVEMQETAHILLIEVDSKAEIPLDSMDVASFDCDVERHFAVDV
jgi:hypothetical protein